MGLTIGRDYGFSAKCPHQRQAVSVAWGLISYYKTYYYWSTAR